ncbi:hypothetical protein [Nocardia sp. NPDC058497]|uniref:hypothetical protein n=1 Tax=Nocardia sp. NPDC058497 TaxID=3346529 RepID=UPI0036465122
MGGVIHRPRFIHKWQTGAGRALGTGVRSALIQLFTSVFQLSAAGGEGLVMQQNESTAATVVALDPAEFAEFDRGCAEFLRVIDQIRALAREIGDQAHWGLGEGDARLISGATVVARLRTKAGGEGNSIGAVMAEHARVVAGIRAAHRVVWNRMMLADEEWAGQLRSVESAAGHHDLLETAP